MTIKATYINPHPNYVVEDYDPPEATKEKLGHPTSCLKLVDRNRPNPEPPTPTVFDPGFEWSEVFGPNESGDTDALIAQADLAARTFLPPGTPFEIRMTAEEDHKKRRVAWFSAPLTYTHPVMEGLILDVACGIYRSKRRA